MARHGREIYVRRRIAVAAIGLLGIGTLGLGGYTAVALGLPLPVTTPGAVAAALPVGADSAPDPADFGSSGIGVVGWDGPLISAGDAAPRPIASITKVITALVALDRMPIESGDGPLRELTAQDAAYFEDAVANAESRAYAAEGTLVSQRDVIEAMLVRSSGNHAKTLADWAFGSQEAYVAAAAAWLAANGLTGTTIVDPTGSDPRNTSTIPDLIRIGELAIADPVLAGIVAQPSADVPDAGELLTTNALLGIDGIDGIKTGTLDEAGACLLFSADAQIGGRTVTLVGAVLGGADHDAVNASVRAMLASAVAGLQELTVPAGTAFGDYDTAWGADAAAVTTAPATLLVWGAETIVTTIELDAVTTAEAGDAIGQVVLSTSHDGATLPLVLDAALPDPGAGWRWTNPGR